MESSAQWSVFAGGIVLGAAVVLAWIWISRRRAGRQPAAWAHDLRTPLASILAYAEILEDGVDEEERGRFLRIIKQEAARIDEMIGRGGGRIPAGTRGRVVPASSSGSATRTVLVVDDDRFIVDATRRLLQRQGFHAVGASGGREALKKARAGRPDLILLDLLMPEMGGEETLKHLRADPRTRDIPVILTTGEPEGPPLPSVADVLIKPIVPDALLAAVARVIPGGTA